MAVTRANLESLVVGRVGPLMEAAGLGVSVTGSNSSLAAPLAHATRDVGGTTADPLTVTTAELAAIATADYDDLFDLSEYRVLETVITNLDDVDITAGPRSEKLSQLVAQVERRLERLDSVMRRLTNPLTAGYISLDFVEHGEDRE